MRKVDRNRIVGRRAWSILAVLLASTAACNRPAPASQTGATASRLPEFTLEDQGGRPFGLTDLHGVVWVADFIATHDGASRETTQRMATLAKDVTGTPSMNDVRFVSFSLDPDQDRADVLRAYATANGADGSRWSFLTGTPSTVRALITTGFKLAAPENQQFIVVGRDGRVRAAIDAKGQSALADVRRAITDALAAPPPQDVYVPKDLREPNWIENHRKAQMDAARTLQAAHDFQLVDRVGSSGITFRHVATEDLGRNYRAVHYDHGTAVAAADVDNDGLPDLYFVNQGGPNALYRNLGGGRFEDITAAAGVAVGHRACVGASFADIDNDGDEDLFVSCVRDGNLLFVNDGHGKFTDATMHAGVAGTGGHSSGAVFFDYDNDGRLDLFVTNVGKYTRDERDANGLWKSFGDAFAGHLHPERFETSVLYHNVGDGRFEDVTKSSGLVHSAWSGEAMPFDYDGDGRTDLYIPSMQGHDELWRNAGNGRFERRSREVFPATPWGAMGVKAFDWNGDGRVDLLVTDMHTDMAADLLPENERRKQDPEKMFPPRFLATDGHHILGNALFTNRGAGKFDEVSETSGVETGWPWGPSVGDLNADGWPDVFISAGMNYPRRYKGNDILLNDGGKRFVPAEYVLGVEPRRRLIRPWFELECDGADVGQDICKGEIAPVMSDNTQTPEQRGTVPARHGHVTVWAARASRSAVVLDLDGDGDLDIVTNDYGDVPQVLISDLAQRGAINFLKIQLVGKSSNRDGLGARITVNAAGRAQVIVNDGKLGYLGQSAVPVYAGLGSAGQANSITVVWPGGQTQVVPGPLKSGATVVVRQR